jgi:hypothetical protein
MVRLLKRQSRGEGPCASLCNSDTHSLTILIPTTRYPERSEGPAPPQLRENKNQIAIFRWIFTVRAARPRKVIQRFRALALEEINARPLLQAIFNPTNSASSLESSSRRAVKRARAFINARVGLRDLAFDS